MYPSRIARSKGAFLADGCSKRSTSDRDVRAASKDIYEYDGVISEPAAIGVGSYSSYYDPYPPTAVEGMPPNSQSYFTEYNILYMFFTSPGSGALTATCYVNGYIVDWPPLPFEITGPTANVSLTYGGTVQVNSNYNLMNGPSLHYGTNSPGNAALAWDYTAHGGDAGKIAVFQTADSTRKNPVKGTYGTGGATCSDRAIPYLNHTFNTGDHDTDLDAPAQPLLNKNVPGNDGIYKVNEHFYDYFVYKSNVSNSHDNSIWVQLGHLDWSWVASIDWEQNGWTWVQTPQTVQDPLFVTYGVPGHDNPAWTCPFPPN